MTVTLGFIGVGVMGEPMCRNLARKSAAAVIAADLRPEPLQRLAEHGVGTARSTTEVAQRSDIVFLSLPGGSELESICTQSGGLLDCARSGQTVVDCSTSPVKLTRELAARFKAQGADFADAPVARTRAAAEAGTLSIMVGASTDVFARIRPFLDCCAAEVTHCGGVGAGQVVKLMNNMVLIQTVVA
ncbi:MAG: NAD(P)-dependent oxidoreductase, partial [Gammaproteobacteria bacterium]|nr:NAD(P)-dependent oxidoreductase [Gammaproteobacteria bacterium]